MCIQVVDVKVSEENLVRIYRELMQKGRQVDNATIDEVIKYFAKSEDLIVFLSFTIGVQVGKILMVKGGD